MVDKFLTIGTQLQHLFQMRCYSVGTNLAYVYRPEVEKNKKMPLLIMLHGATQSALEFSGQTQMNKLAEKYGFCVAYVDKNIMYNPIQAFDWITPKEENHDIKSVEELISTLISRDDIDKEKIYIAGLSAGAALTAMFVEKNPHMIAGAAMIAGLPANSATTIKEAKEAMKEGSKNQQSYHVSNPHIKKCLKFLIIHGNVDDVVKIKNSQITYEAMKELIDYTDDNRLNNSGEKSIANFSNGNKITSTIAKNGSKVVLEEINGMNHVWRGGDSQFRYSDIGEKDNQFSVSEKIVTFFELNQSINLANKKEVLRNIEKLRSITDNKSIHAHSKGF